MSTKRTPRLSMNKDDNIHKNKAQQIKELDKQIYDIAFITEKTNHYNSLNKKFKLIYPKYVIIL